MLQSLLVANTRLPDMAGRNGGNSPVLHWNFTQNTVYRVKDGVTGYTGNAAGLLAVEQTLNMCAFGWRRIGYRHIASRESRSHAL